jgi:hypothetical protein
MIFRLKIIDILNFRIICIRSKYQVYLIVIKRYTI